jgi:AFG3 family protein
MSRLSLFLWGLRISTYLILCQHLFNHTFSLPTIIDSSLPRINSLLINDTNYFDYVVVNEYTNMAYFHKNSSYSHHVSISQHSDFGNTLNKLYNDTFITNVQYITNKPIISYIFDLVFYWLICNIILFTIGYYLSSALSDIQIPGIPGLSKDGLFKIVKPDIDGIMFKDVIGHKEGKKDMMECTKYFQNRERYIEVGYKIPKGLLLIGQPGTGKTLLARAFANEAKVNFISVCGSDFIEMYVGLGSKRVRELFELARENSPCVIFIDEIDSIGSKRSSQSVGSSEHMSTLNKILSEIDGFVDNDNIMMVGATNRLKSLDPALTRSGRFDKKIFFDEPNIDERVDCFELFLKKIKLDDTFMESKDKYVRSLAKMTAGLTGADIENICNESARIFISRYAEDVDTKKGIVYDDLEKAIDIVMIGIEKPERKMTELERETVSHHEAGHSLIAYMMRDTAPPIKTSIIPRGESALGFSQQEPDDRKLITYNELFARMCVLIGGRSAESVIYNHYSTGASDDIERLTNLAYTMITKYGMSNVLGPLYVDLNDSNLSNDTRRMIDTEVSAMIMKAQNQTIGYLEIHIIELKLVAKYLLEKEVLLTEDLDNILETYNVKNIY